MNNEIKIGQVYRHYKGNHYEVMLIGRHSETSEELVGYRRKEDGHVYFRPKAMFFDLVEVDGKQMTRFTLVSGTVKQCIIEAYGWYGVVALLGAYVAVSFGYIASDDIVFQVLNATGAMGIVVDALAQKNWQPAVLNVIWCIVALGALIKLLS